MEDIPSLNMPVQKLKVEILPLELPCSGPVTHSGEILTTSKSHRKKPDIDIDNKLNDYLKIIGILNNVFGPQKKPLRKQ
jgi:hypothetical protein